MVLALLTALLTCSVPGAINPIVAQDTIVTTICTPGWTDTIRPPSIFTNAIKRKLLGRRHSSARMKAFELDHCVSLELGGHSTSPANLWLQPWSGRCGARAKDKWETRLKRQVCAGMISLDTARVRVKRWC